MPDGTHGRANLCRNPARSVGNQELQTFFQPWSAFFSRLYREPRDPLTKLWQASPGHARGGCGYAGERFPVRGGCPPLAGHPPGPHAVSQHPGRMPVSPGGGFQPSAFLPSGRSRGGRHPAGERGGGLVPQPYRAAFPREGGARPPGPTPAGATAGGRTAGQAVSPQGPARGPPRPRSLPPPPPPGRPSPSGGSRRRLCRMSR